MRSELGFRPDQERRSSSCGPAMAEGRKRGSSKRLGGEKPGGFVFQGGIS